jgi:hypothetical protein
MYCILNCDDEKDFFLFIIHYIYCIIDFMKKIFLLTIFITVGLRAQFNYQAIVKDNNGDVIISNQVKFKFSLMYQSSTTSPVYVEEHDITTPADGVNNLTVGGGTVVNGSFSDIDWSQSVFMKEELDAGGGYQDMGTRQIVSVPIAEYAKVSNTSSQTFVTGDSNIQIGTIIGQTNGGHNNIAIGKNSLLNANGTSRNISIGENSMKDNAGGATNVSIGSLSLSNNTLGNSNVSIGYANSIFNKTGSRNINIGEYSGYNNESGSNNVNIGFRANYQNQGTSAVNHSNVTTLGAKTLINGPSISNSTAIGAEATVTASNTIQLGNTDVTLVNTSGVVSATGFVGDGSGLTGLNLSANYDDKGNLIILDSPVSYTESNTSNIVIGQSSMASVTLSKNNVAIGNSALRDGSTSYDNVAVGVGAMREAKYSQKNTAIGAYALMRIGKNLDRYYDYYEDGVMYSNQNTALGNGAAARLEEGNWNTSLGAQSMVNVIKGDANVAIGDRVFEGFEGAHQNVAIGTMAGVFNSEWEKITGGTVSRTTLIGFQTRIIPGIENSVALGYQALVTSSNTIQLGNDNVALVNTSGVVSATGFVGDGSRLTNVGLGGSIDENGNLKIVDHSPTMTTSQTNNVLIGSGVATGLTDAYDNVAIGTSALASATTTFGNIALGASALRSSSSAYDSNTSSSSTGFNVAVGYKAMRDMDQGWVNVAIGSTAMLNTKKGTGNIAIGAGTMEDPSFGQNNIALGTDAIHRRENMNAVAIGNQALFNVTNIPDESNFALDPEVSNLQEFIARTDNPSTTLDESMYGLPGNIAIGAGAFASPQASTATITEISMENIAIGHMSMNSVTKQTGGNIAIGSQSLPVMEQGGGNISIGQWSLNQFKEGGGNTIIGNGGAQRLQKGDQLTLIGQDVAGGAKNISAATAVGIGAMFHAGNAVQNTVFGRKALMRVGETLEMSGYQYDENGNRSWVVSGTSNVAIGPYNMQNTDSGYENVSIGRSAMISNISGAQNVAVGDRALRRNNSDFNTGVGRHALEKNVDGKYNTALGYFAGSLQNTQGDNANDYNTYLGALTNTVSGSTVQNSTAIGYEALVTTSNTIQLGNDNVALVNTSGVVSATGFVGDGSGLTGLNLSANYDDKGNLIILDSPVSYTESNTSNIVIGQSSMASVTLSKNNVAIGNSALRDGSTSYDNVAVGVGAMREAKYSQKNTAIGAYALMRIGKNLDRYYDYYEDGVMYSNQNTALGNGAAARLEEGNWNTSLGAQSMVNVIKGDANVAIGDRVFEGFEGAHQNVAIGTMAGVFNSEWEKITGGTVSRTTLIGFQTRIIPGIENSVALGYQALVTSSNTIQLGNDNVALVNTSGVVSATGFVGDGSRLTNVGLGGSIDENGNLIIVDVEPTLTISQTNNILVGAGVAPYLTDGYNNIGIGGSALASATTTFDNVAIGHTSMGNSNNSSRNVAVGYMALRDLNTLTENTAYGTVTLTTVSTYPHIDYQSGRRNVAVGDSAMRRATGGSWNTAIGAGSLQDLENGIENVALGKDALGRTKQTSFNVAIGISSMRNLSGTVTYTDDNNVVQFFNSSGNTAIGSRTMTNAGYGMENVAIGNWALHYNNANYNVSIGSHSMRFNDDGADNVAIGGYALHTNSSGDNNTAAGRRSLEKNTHGNRNTAFGSDSSINNTIGAHNTSLGSGAARDAVNIDGVVAVGSYAMASMTNDPDSHSDNTKSENTAVGYYAMSGDENTINTGMSNTALGFMSLKNLSLGNFNTAIGPYALFYNTTGSSNIALGDKALNSNVSGNNNIAIGKETLFSNIVSSNIGIGFKSLTATVSGSHNVSIGEESMLSNVSGFKNVAIGASSMRNANGSNYQNTSVGHDSSKYMNGNNNTSIGMGSGRNIDDPNNQSNNNTFLGKSTGATDGTASIQNSTAIGADAEVSSDHTMVFGDQDVNKWAFGLATTDTGKVIQVGSDTTNGNGAYLTAGGTWTNGSSILFKTNFIDLSSEWILDKISKLNIRKWDYKNTNETHIGPTSEEFIDLFGVGIENENAHISTIDVSGVALKGVQALIDENKVQKEQLENQNNLINELYNRILVLEKKISE